MLMQLSHKYQYYVLNLNTAVQLVLGSLLLIAPSMFQTLVHTQEPAILFRIVGVMALSMALLSGYSVIEYGKVGRDQKWLVPIATLTFFHGFLAVFLTVAALQGLISWLGVIVHGPMFILFAIAWVRTIFSN